MPIVTLKYVYSQQNHSLKGYWHLIFMDAIKPCCCWYVFFTSCFSELWCHLNVGFSRAFFSWGIAGLDFGQQHPGSSRRPSSGTCACQGVSAHVTWTFNEAWWNSTTYLETHVGSFTVASWYNKAKKFLSCCMEKSGPEICDI